jgi:soluble lytic murein transglycosylase-like protein
MKRVVYLIGAVAGLGVIIMKSGLSYDAIISVYRHIVERYADAYKVDKTFVYAIIKQESDGFPLALGKTSDFGLMQITQPALTDYNNYHGENLTLLDIWLSPEKNIKVGTWYLSWLLSQFDGDYTFAVSSYNQGIGNVRRGTYSTEYYDAVHKHKTQFTERV